jgi:hypothetical protein
MGENGSPAEPAVSPPAPSDTPQLAEASISDDPTQGAISIEGLDPHDHEALKGIDHWQDIRLKKRYALGLLWLVGAQLLIADAVFVAYAWAGMGWKLEPEVIQIWLGGTLIELVTVALVVTQYLFPRRDGLARDAAER